MIELIQFTFRCRCDKLMRDRDLIRRWSRRNDSFTFCTNNYPEVSMSVYKERKAPPDRPLAINYSTMLKKEDEGNWTWCAYYENHYWKALRRVACYLLFLRQFVTLNLSYISVSATYSCQVFLAKVFAKIR